MNTTHQPNTSSSTTTTSLLRDGRSRSHSTLARFLRASLGGAAVIACMTTATLVSRAATGTVFCPGDGTGFSCPCSNPGASGSGCGNSVNPTGARLSGSGVASITSDTFVLDCSGMPNGPAMYIQGTSQLNGGLGFFNGDGLRCVGGAVIRLGARVNVAGVSQFPGLGGAPVSVEGSITIAGTRTYQVWYRDSTQFCQPEGFNLSNGLSVVWAP